MRRARPSVRRAAALAIVIALVGVAAAAAALISEEPAAPVRAAGLDATAEAAAADVGARDRGSPITSYRITAFVDGVAR